ncbi:MAG: hypothetical protein QOJ29_1898, partial [Thermoleophilaceae bacterium]|nr:hypothetical protein [Thermoleophilaceae bacterium]
KPQIDAEDVEVLPQVPHTRIEFNDVSAESLLEQWILDAADLETANDEARLSYEVFSHTEMWFRLSSVNGARCQSLQRSRKVIPASLAMRSNSEGQT